MSSALSWYRVCNVLRQPVSWPRTNSVFHPEGSFSYSTWKLFKSNSPCSTRRLIVSAFCSARCMAALLGANRVHAVWRNEKADRNSASSCPTNSERLLRGHEFVLLEGRGDNVKGVNLGRSLDKSCQRLQHLRIGTVVVVVGIFLVFPQTDRGHINSAGTGESDFVLKAVLLTQQRQDVFFKSSCVIGQHIRLQLERDIACKHISNLLRVVVAAKRRKLQMG